MIADVQFITVWILARVQLYKKEPTALWTGDRRLLYFWTNRRSDWGRYDVGRDDHYLSFPMLLKKQRIPARLVRVSR